MSNPYREQPLRTWEEADPFPEPLTLATLRYRGGPTLGKLQLAVVTREEFLQLHQDPMFIRMHSTTMSEHAALDATYPGRYVLLARYADVLVVLEKT